MGVTRQALRLYATMMNYLTSLSRGINTSSPTAPVASTISIVLNVRPRPPRPKHKGGKNDFNHHWIRNVRRHRLLDWPILQIRQVRIVDWSWRIPIMGIRFFHVCHLHGVEVF